MLIGLLYFFGLLFLCCFQLRFAQGFLLFFNFTLFGNRTFFLFFFLDFFTAFFLFLFLNKLLFFQRLQALIFLFALFSLLLGALFFKPLRVINNHGVHGLDLRLRGYFRRPVQAHAQQGNERHMHQNCVNQRG